MVARGREALAPTEYIYDMDATPAVNIHGEGKPLGEVLHLLARRRRIWGVACDTLVAFLLFVCFGLFEILEYPPSKMRFREKKYSVDTNWMAPTVFGLKLCDVIK